MAYQEPDPKGEGDFRTRIAIPQKNKSNTQNATSSTVWNLIKEFRSFRLMTDDFHNLLALVSILSDPVNMLPAIVNTPTDGIGSPGNPGLFVNSQNLGWSVATLTWRFQKQDHAVRQISALNSANVVLINQTNNLHDILDIHMTTSAGTATLQIEISVDNVNFIALEAPIAAAATTVKHYNNTVVGGTVALCPLAFPFIRITAGAAGVGNTTTLTVGLK